MTSILAVGEFGLAIAALVFVGCMIWLGISKMRQSAHAGRLLRQFEELLPKDWEAAAGILKEAIVVQLSSAEETERLTRRLEKLYREHGLQVDLAAVRECPGILREIEKSKADAKETGRLIGQTFLKAQTILDECGPGEIRD